MPAWGSEGMVMSPWKLVTFFGEKPKSYQVWATEWDMRKAREMDKSRRRRGMVVSILVLIFLRICVRWFGG